MTDWVRLMPAMEARCRRDEAALAAARTQERRIEAALTALDHRSGAALAVAGMEHQATGAAPLWQEETRRRRAALLRELALARARSGDAEARLRAALGRKDGVARLAQQAAAARHAAALRRQEAAMLAWLILGAGR
ncbi:MAG: hypothetical protein ACLFQF_07380 [Rhodosalinus sp.]